MRRLSKKLKTSTLVWMAVVATNSMAEPPQSSESKPLGGIVEFPDHSPDVAWKKTASTGIPGNTGWTETWELVDRSATNEFQIRFDFRRQVPPPHVSEVARAFRTAASRTSYASDVSDREMPDGSQWVDFKLPMQGESGVRRIMSVNGGVASATVSTALNPPYIESKSSKSSWDAIMAVLSTLKYQPYRQEKEEPSSAQIE